VMVEIRPLPSISRQSSTEGRASPSGFKAQLDRDTLPTTGFLTGQRGK
jgi:hypothetical protein